MTMTTVLAGVPQDSARSLAPTGFRTPAPLLPETSIRGLLFGGTAILAVGLGGLIGWAALAPLHGAIIAQGALAPETGRKTVKHQEAGQIAELLVRDGATVRAGQVLLRFDRTEAATRLEVLTSSWLDQVALEARLQAELLETAAIAWPEALLHRAGSAEVDKLMSNQRTLFDVRRTQLDSEGALIAERIVTLEEKRKSLDSQRRFLGRELELVGEDLRITSGLLARGNTTRSRLVEHQKEEARIQSRDHELEVEIAKTRQEIVEAKSDLVHRRNEFREKVLVDLEKARGEVSKLVEQIRDAANRLATRDVRAPDDGIVVLHGHPAVGVTVAANEPILDIIPVEQTLLAEVRVQPQDVKSLAVDLPVQVQLTAYDSRVVGSLDGTVDYVSADRLTDQATHADYYLVRVRLKDADPHTVHTLKIKPGMPVEARIVLSARTPLDYLFKPLSHSYLRAFVQE